MTKLYYCLAETVVNGEIIIQGTSVTYSASASAFASANTSFKDAAKVATVDSNTAATVAARKIVNEILVQYSYVLSEENINSMISNNLKTSINLITPVLLKKIASTVDNINYILNKNITISSTEFLFIPTGKSLTIPSNLKFFNNGRIQIGDNNSIPNPKRAKNTNLGAAGPTACTTQFVTYVPDSGTAIGGTYQIGTGIADQYACLKFFKANSSSAITPVLSNQAVINNNAGGQVIVSGVSFANIQGGSTVGVVNNTSSTSYFYSDPTGSIVA
jgi:hypothetical protein